MGRNTSESSSPPQSLEKQPHIYRSLAFLSSLINLSPGSRSHQFSRVVESKNTKTNKQNKTGLSLEFLHLPSPLFCNFYLVSLIWDLSEGNQLPSSPSRPLADQPLVHTGEKDLCVCDFKVRETSLSTFTSSLKPQTSKSGSFRTRGPGGFPIHHHNMMRWAC